MYERSLSRSDIRLSETRSKPTDHRRRMWITLASLAAAMTATTWLLSWIDPSPPVPFGDRYLVELERMAHSAVIDGVELRPTQWSLIDIQVSPSTWSTTPGVMLAAGAGSGFWHFRVDRNGRPVRASAWSNQQSIAGYPRTVRIQLTRPRGDNDFPVAQRFGVRALVESLRQVLPTNRAPITVTMPPEDRARLNQKT